MDALSWFSSASYRLCFISGAALLSSGCISLGLAVFQLAFLIEPQQIMFRALVQFYLVFMGWQLLLFREAPFSPQLMLSTCAIVTATIGLVIGSVELTLILWTQPLVFRMAFYILLLMIGFIVSPHNKYSVPPEPNKTD